MREVPVPPDRRLRREDEDELVEVVGQHQRDERPDGQVQQPRPPRQPVPLGPPQRRRDEHRQQRDDQHRQIIKVPEPADHIRIGHEEILHRPLRDTEHHERGDARGQAAHLRLHHPAAQGDPPREEQADVQERPQQAEAPAGQDPPEVAAEDGDGNIVPIKNQSPKQRIDGTAALLDCYVGLYEHYNEYTTAI